MTIQESYSKAKWMISEEKDQKVPKTFNHLWSYITSKNNKYKQRNILQKRTNSKHAIYRDIQVHLCYGPVQQRR